MLTAKALSFIIVVNVLATKISIETIKCKKCQVKIISKQTSAIKFRFYAVVELVIRTLISNLISPAEILTLLPSEIASRLRSKCATTINDIFQESGPLDSELKWYSFAPLALLVEKFGDSKCEQELKKYVILLQTFLRTRSVANPIPHLTTMQLSTQDDLASPDKSPELLSPQEVNSNDMPTIQVLVDPEWETDLVHPDSNEREREYIACLLGTTTNNIQFVQVT